MTTRAGRSIGGDWYRRPASQGTRTTRRMSQYNVMSVFPDMDSARKAINTLGRAGIEADDISLTGGAADTAASQEDTASADATAMTAFFQSAGLGGAMGMFAGLVLGPPITFVVFDVFNIDVTIGSILGGTTMGILLLGIVGALVGQYYPVHAAQPWELSFHRTPGGVILGVHTDEPKHIERARQALASLQPLDLYYVDEQGRRL